MMNIIELNVPDYVRYISDWTDYKIPDAKVPSQNTNIESAQVDAWERTLASYKKTIEDYKAMGKPLPEGFLEKV